MTFDFRFENHGSICLLRPFTQPARDWLAANIDPEAQYFAGALAVEPRYAHPIIHDLVAEGYRVEFL